MILSRISSFLLLIYVAFLSSSISVQSFKIIQPSPKSRLGINTAIKSAESEIDASVKASTSSKKVSILVCPAQFCVPADYESFFATLKSYKDTKNNGISIGTCRVVPLPRTEWIKVAKQLPTAEFFKGELNVSKTLGWYFDAIENGLADIFAEEGEDANVAIIGHSIGGWVARAYLGGLSCSATAVNRLGQRQISSLITLGTPHISPEGALVDQTRGLLRAIEESPSCSSSSLVSRGVDITCVGSSSVKGKILTTDIEELVAIASYFPLTGNLGGSGDGIVPLDLAFMESPARKVVIEESQHGNPVKHANVLPTPWNLWDGYAPSISLPDDFLWYGSDTVVDEWADYIS